MSSRSSLRGGPTFSVETTVVLHFVRSPLSPRVSGPTGYSVKIFGVVICGLATSSNPRLHQSVPRCEECGGCRHLFRDTPRYRRLPLDLHSHPALQR